VTLPDEVFTKDVPPDRINDAVGPDTAVLFVTVWPCAMPPIAVPATEAKSSAR